MKHEKLCWSESRFLLILMHEFRAKVIYNFLSTSTVEDYNLRTDDVQRHTLMNNTYKDKM